jgi:hypothetical protein
LITTGLVPVGSEGETPGVLMTVATVLEGIWA